MAFSMSRYGKVRSRFPGFVQESPNNGQPATEKTEVRFAYSKGMLYVSIKAFDKEPEKISKRLQRRDTDFHSDWVVIYLDPNHDRRTGYSFRISSAGVEVDSIMFDDVQSQSSWDAIWDSATGRMDNGWCAELAIPFSQLSLPKQGQSVWGVNVERALDRKSEIAYWVHNPHDVSGRVSRFGELHGLNDLAADKNLELLPFFLSKGTFEGGDSEDEYEVGLDLTYRLGASFRLDATVNPDFGQVEADPSVLNLTVFETFFPEKRQFFLRGSEIFSTRFNQFFSRRIGKRPNHFRLPKGVSAVSRPDQTRILGAAKLSGTTEGGTTVGLITATTDEEYAGVVFEDGSTGRQLIEPQTHYLTGRVKQDILGGNGFIGGMATGVLREGSFNAYTAAADWEMYLHDRKWITRGNLIGSETGPEDARRQGWGVDLALDSVGYRNWDLEIDLDYYNDELDLNDLGFLSRNNLVDFAGGVTRTFQDPHGPFLRRSHNLYTGYQTNTDGFNLDRWFFHSTEMTFRNYWRMDIELTAFNSTYNDRITRGGPLVRFDGGKRILLAYSSNRNRPLSFSNNVRYTDRDDSSFDVRLGFSMDYYPMPALQLSLGASYTREKSIAQWVDNVPDATLPQTTHYVFGRLDSEILDLTLRTNWTFNPEMSLQIFSQPFLAAGDYSDLKELAEAATDRFTPFDYRDDPNFNIGSFIWNAVYRWEFAPGSQLFVIWNEGRNYFDRVGALQPDDNFSDLFDATPVDTFVIKISKWFNR